MKEQSSSSKFLKTDGGKTKSNAIEVPSISLPKGGGAIKGIDEKFSVNAVNGTASFSIPLPFSDARGVSPSLSLSYNSGSGNGPFGLGWNLGLASIKRKTDKCLPQYIDAIDSDTFIFSEAEDLVPEFQRQADGSFSHDAQGEYVFHEIDSLDSLFTIRFFRPRIEGLFARIERWTEKSSGIIKWRIMTKNNVTTLMGWSSASVIADPADSRKIYEWLPEFVYDDKGNCTHYIYQQEDDKGFDTTLLHHKNRLNNGKITYTNLYLQKVLYGNKTPYAKLGDAYPADTDFMFQTVFDYGEYDVNPPYAKIKDWDFRTDSFSWFKPGFEIRTTRLCKRVMLFHYFKELPGGSALVRSIDFVYDTAIERDFTFLQSMTSCGYIKKSNGTYTQKKMPATEFEYQKHEWNKDVETIATEDLVHAPAGLDEQQYQFTDLYNEGLSGILTEQSRGWYYKHNLGDGKFEQAQLVSPKPSLIGLGAQLQLVDLDGDGTKQLVNYNTEPKGYFELNDYSEWQPFRNFKDNPNIDFKDANTRMIDLNGDGKPDALISEDNVFKWYESEGRDGFSQYHQTTIPIDDETGPQIVFSDPKQSIFLADMTGDGLTDIVRIRNADVCYWPNLGFGRFGAKISMDNAPLFDHPDAFNPAFIKLADIDGSGTTDIIYLGKNKFICWTNLSGNAFNTLPFEIEQFPGIDNRSKVSVTDLLGNGVACIVWSSAMPKDAGSPLRYIDLMQSRKPHIMAKYLNNLGKEVSFEYTPSTTFYIEDKLAGRPWVTRLHFPVHCVSRTETIDKVSGWRFVSSYKYHHGYYDQAEREFRGFGMVEQTDAEDFENWAKGNATNIVDETVHQAPVVTKSWFHTGAFVDREKILGLYENDYWYAEMQRQGFTVANHEVTLADARIVATPGIPNLHTEHLDIAEWREALRSCKGMALRAETFVLDAPSVSPTPAQIEKQLTPYTVATHNCVLELLQPKGKNLYAVYVAKESEAITYNYERDTADPRIAHNLNIKLDEYGNVLESAAVVYPRVSSDASLPAQTQSEQTKTVIIYTQNAFTNDVIDSDVYRLRLASEAKTYEMKGVSKAGTFYTVSDFYSVSPAVDILSTATEVPYQNVDTDPAAGTTQKRLIEHIRSTYYANDLKTALPLYHLASLAVPYESYQLAYTPALLTDIFGGKTTDALMTEGKFVHSEGDLNWWIQSGTTQLIEGAETAADAAKRFYVPMSYIDPYGSKTSVTYYADYFLFAETMTDQLGNKSEVDLFNFRTLSPQRMKDLNGNLSEAISDELGLVKAVAIFGKGTEADDLTGLSEATEQAETDMVGQFFSVPDTADGVADSVALTTKANQLLQHATSRFAYDMDVYKTTGKPVVVASIVREEHFKKKTNSPIQISMEYSNGLGKVVMKKVQAEPGAARKVTVKADMSYTVSDIDTSALATPQLRWIGNGKTIVNNKGNTVKQYEPYFSVTPAYESLPELVETGVTPIMYYDALSRLIRTEMPDGKLTRTVFDSWHQSIYDANDTILQSSWYHDRTNRLIDAGLLAEGKDPVAEKAAADNAAKHADTPNVLHFDTLGRPVLSIDNNRDINTNADIFLRTKVYLDAEGNLRRVNDARELPENGNLGNVVMQYKYDMLGHLVYQNSMDAGQRWLLHNILGNPLRTWDERSHEFQYSYDELHRPTQNMVIGGDGAVALNNIHERMIYGESLLAPGRTNEATIQALNILGKPIKHFDTAGVVLTPQYDFKGQPTSSTRQLFSKYKSVADWTDAHIATDLETGTFIFTSEIDALGRISLQTAPDGSVTTPSYNRTGLLAGESVDHLNPDKSVTHLTHIKSIEYNEKGQRSKVLYGNDVRSKFTYDKETFRVIRIESTRPADSLQDWNYTFDPVGNITHLIDKEIPTVFFNNIKVTGASDYIYDALYRLVSATGRENDAALTFDLKDNWNDTAYIHQMNPGDPMAMRNYLQSYQYDEVGNITEMDHKATGNNWTRDYTYEKTNNRIKTTQIGAQTYTYTHHPQHGFITTMPNLDEMGWSFKEELVKSIQQRVSPESGTAETTYYQYDAGGQRVRKITENSAAIGMSPTRKDERIYIAGYETYRSYNADVLSLERETLGLLDESHRFVMIETVIHNTNPAPDPSDAIGARLLRYQLDNHLGSAALELDISANVISYEEYHPFGTTAYQAMSKTIKATAKRYRYTGMERDDETGLEYHSARYYISWLGRWLSADPIGIGDGVNMYAYTKNNPVMKMDSDGTQATPDQTRFRQIYDGQRASNPSNAHLATLVAAFSDSQISGANPNARFLSILALTGGDLPHGPTGHFDTYTIRQIGTESGPNATGDTGFRRELRDSIRYRTDTSGGDIPMHRLSSDQIGHFLTAAHIGYTITDRDNYINKAIADAQQFTNEHPFLSIIANRMTIVINMQLQYSAEANAYQRAMIGHELIADRSLSGIGITSTVASPFMASITDVQNFFNRRLDLIAIDDRQQGNSYQDILLTWIGYRFGQNVANGKYATSQEEGRWLNMMLGNQDLAAVPASDPFYQDAQQVQGLLQQFRDKQAQIHPTDLPPTR